MTKFVRILRESPSVSFWSSKAVVGEIYRVRYEEDADTWYLKHATLASCSAKKADVEEVSVEEACPEYSEQAFFKPFLYIKEVSSGKLFLPEATYPTSGGRVTVDGYAGDSYVGLYSDEPNIGFAVVGFEEEQVEILPEVLTKWGMNYHLAQKTKGFGSLSGFFYEQFPEDMKAFECVRLRFSTFVPEHSKKVPGGVSIYQNLEKSKKDLSTAYPKPGRAFRAMFPEATDSQIERWVDKFRELFPVNSYVLKVSGEAEDFRKAYKGEQVPTQNIRHTQSRKSIANSCMRYEFDLLPIHPVEVYASGDFKIFWTEAEGGRVGSRCVVYFPEGEKPQAGPIYGACEASLDRIEEELRKLDAALFTESDWVGAKLLAVPHKRGGYIGPYLDGDEKRLELVGDFLVVTHRGSIDGENYSGILGEDESLYCEDCGDEVEEDEVYRSPDGECLCSTCYDANYIYCEHYEDTRPSEGSVRACRLNRFGILRSILISGEAAENDYTYCEQIDEWWLTDSVVELADGTYTSVHSINQDLFESCQLTDEVYPIAELSEFGEGGGFASTKHLKENGYTPDENGVYQYKEAA